MEKKYAGQFFRLTLKVTGIKHIHIVRPSLLLGRRKEFRLGERAAQIILPAISFLLPKKYRPVQAGKVAEEMVEAVKKI